MSCDRAGPGGREGVPVAGAQRRHGTAAGLRTFFEPRGIAVVGARSTPGFGYDIPLILKKLGWADRVYLVNPRGGELHGMPVYGCVADIPDPVDLAVVIVPGPSVPGVLAEIADRGIRHAIVQSAGFAEIGPRGQALQLEARRVAEERGVRVIGPNCVGVVNTANRFTTASVMPEALTPGPLAVIAQSGVFGHNLLDMLNRHGVYVSKVVTLGNRLDVDESDILEYFREDPLTRAAVLYLEGAADGRRLSETLRRVSREKPVLVLKSGRTLEGRAATESHTGSLSGEDALYESAFAQNGAVRAATLQELVDFGRVFSTQPLPRGNRLGIVTGSGSMGALATDVAVTSGLRVLPLSEATFRKATAGAPDWMNAKNPLDVGPSPQFPLAFEAMLDDPEIDMVLAIVAIPYAAVQHIGAEGSISGRFLGNLAALRAREGRKPVLVCVVSHGRLVEIFQRDLEPGIPVFTSPEPAVRSLAALWRQRRWLQTRV